MTESEIAEQLFEIAEELHEQSLTSSSFPITSTSTGTGGDTFTEWDTGIQSQDSFAPWIKQMFNNPTSTSTSTETSTLQRHDIIVEKLHIHYGLKQHNPVNRMRFYSKYNCDYDRHIAKSVKESSYETLLPRNFEELSIRIFCRDSSKSHLLLEAFQVWCRKVSVSSPFQTMSQI
jgi:hypothetical protein